MSIWDNLHAEIQGIDTRGDVNSAEHDVWLHVQASMERRALARGDAWFLSRLIVKDYPALAPWLEKLTQDNNINLEEAYRCAHILVYDCFLPGHTAHSSAFLFAELLIALIFGEDHVLSGSDCIELLTSMATITLDPGGGRPWSEIQETPFFEEMSCDHKTALDHKRLYYSLLSSAAIAAQFANESPDDKAVISAAVFLEHLSGVTSSLVGDEDVRFQAWSKWLRGLGAELDETVHEFIFVDDMIDLVMELERPIQDSEFEDLLQLLLCQGFEPRFALRLFEATRRYVQQVGASSRMRRH